MFVIWSYEHDAWWKANWGGYTQFLFEAGDYSEDEAKKICEDANKHLEQGQKNEVYMSRSDAEKLEKDQEETEESDRYDCNTCHQA